MYDLAGIAINQNGAQEDSADSIALTSTPVYQWFLLPADWLRGPAHKAPDLVGFQILVDIDQGQAANASINWTLDNKDLLGNFDTLASGVATGAETDGTQVWFTVYLPNPVSTNGLVSPITGSTWFRLGISTGAHVTAWRYTVPNPLSFRGMARDGTDTNLLDATRSFSFMFRVLAATADDGVDFLGNVYRSMVSDSGATNVSSTLSDAFWLSGPCPSRFGVCSLYFDVRQAGLPAVIDSILLDPLTPGIACHIYWTTVGAPGTSAADWDNRLWNPIGSGLTLDSAQSYFLPEPITTNYVKLEFSRLQAMPYQPGDLHAAVTYNKYPQWVEDYFLSRVPEPDFSPGSTSVQFDHLDLAFQPPTDDLIQAPAPPATASPGPTSDPTKRIDPNVLTRINAGFKPFQSVPWAHGQSTTLLGQSATSVLPTSYPTEFATTQVTSVSAVSSTDRDDTVAQLVRPDMFFFIPARHIYRIVQATYPNNTAHFAGLRTVAFQRTRYTVASDTPMYVESMGDNANMSRNDFFLSPLMQLTTYDTTAVGTGAGTQSAPAPVPPPASAAIYGISPTRIVLP